MVKASTSERGRPNRSIARHATISAWVESSPPETPMTTVGRPIERSRCSSPDTWIEYASKQSCANRAASSGTNG
jgi:hypothetical protein